MGKDLEFHSSRNFFKMAVFRDVEELKYQWAGIKDGVEVQKLEVLIIRDPPPGCLALYRRHSISTKNELDSNADVLVGKTFKVISFSSVLLI